MKLRWILRRKPRVEHDWVKGLLMLLAFLLALAWLDSLDREVEARESAQRRLQELKEIHRGPYVRLVGSGFECSLAPIQREWERVALAQCRDLAATLRMGRLTR